MNKKIIYVGIPLLAVLIIFGIFIWDYSLEDPLKDYIIEEDPREEVLLDPLVMGGGWSSNENEEGAVEEAFSMMELEMEGKDIEFLILYSESGYDNEVISSLVNQRVSGTKIYGWTSLQGSVTNDGIKKLSMLGFSDRVKAGVGGAALEETNYPGEEGTREEIFSSAYQAAVLATERALEDAGGLASEEPRFVLISGATYFYPGTIENPIEERFLEGIESVIGEGVPVVGGLAADTMAAGNEKVFVNDQVYDLGSVSVALVYTDVKMGASPSLKVGYGFLGGFTPTTKYGVVTKADGHLLYEIDGRPCAEVYDEWTEGGLGDRINTKEWVIDYTAFYPLSNKISEDDEVPGYYNKLIHYFNEPEEGVCKVAAEVEEGEIIRLMEGTESMFVNRGALTAMFARSDGRLTAEEIAGGYMVFCAGSFLGIDPVNHPRISSSINEVLAGSPYIGGYEFGGFGSFVGVQENVFTTQMTSFLLFGKN